MVATWREIQKQNFTHWEELADFLELGEALRSEILQRPRFVLNLPRRLANKMAKNTLDDPLLRQFLPLAEESKSTSGFSVDPVGDTAARKGGKLIHKYRGRALLLASGACAMHCRFCFRQNFPYERGDPFFEEELEIIARDSSLTEIILSGGDPLSLSNQTLGGLMANLGEIPHLKRVRFHTRFPIGIPERIDGEFLQILEESPLQIFFVIHCNHSRELDEDIFVALKKIQRLGIPLLNHSVLLKGVNDETEILAALYSRLVDQGILPYYLNQLDKVQGSAHFEVSTEKGLQIIEELTSSLSGYAVPRYVREVEGMPSKTTFFRGS